MTVAVPLSSEVSQALVQALIKQAPQALDRYTEFASAQDISLLSSTAKAPKIREMRADADGVAADGWEARFLRWELQRCAWKLLGRTHRVGVCHRRLAPAGRGDAAPEPGVRVYRRLDKATYYRGLMVCASVWACPICSAKIAERRRAELDQAVTAHLAAGGGVYHAVLTIPHQFSDKPYDLVDNLLKSFRGLCSGRFRLPKLFPRARFAAKRANKLPKLIKYREFNKLSYMGFVKALEVTHGANGWHPHLHLLVFTDHFLSKKDLELTEHKIWIKWESHVFKNFGKLPSKKAFRFEQAAQGHFEEANIVQVYDEYVYVCPVTGYITKFGADREIEEIVKMRKWGAADEITRGHLKKAGKKGRSPWQLLADYQLGDERSGELWLDFVIAFKGKSQLQWSTGLRKKLGLDTEKSDEEAAEAVEAEDILIALIQEEDWEIILKHNLRAVVLEILRENDYDAVQRMLDIFRSGSVNELELEDLARHVHIVLYGYAMLCYRLGRYIDMRPELVLRL